MSPKVLASIAVFVLLFGVVSSAYADDKTDLKPKTKQQTKSKSLPAANNSGLKQNCANNLESIKKSLDVASEKAGALKEKLYSEWNSQYSSGQIKDDWNVYSKKLENSQEMQNYRQIQEKYNSILATCTGDFSQPKSQESRVEFTQSNECISAQKMIDSIDQRYSSLKEKAYNDWKSQNMAGSYPGTWEQFADEKLVKSPEVIELNTTREKYEPVLRTCIQSIVMPTDVSQPKSLPLVSTKIDQKPSSTDDSAKKSDKSPTKITKVKSDKIIKKTVNTKIAIKI